MLIDGGHQVDVAFNIEQEIKPEIFEMGCKVYELPLQRSPLSRDNFKAYRMLKNIINSEEYDLVHTHTPVASAIVRLACRKLNSVKVFYTAHGFHFFKGAPIRNWLVYYPIEKCLARYTDTLITINKEDYERAKSKFKAKRVEYIPGVGIDLEKFNAVEIDRALKRSQLGLPEDAFVILSVGELNKNKNHEVIIRAISKIDNPHIHYVICGEGQLDEYLRNLSKELGIEKQVHLLGFRKDVAEIGKASDIFAFPSKREGLGLAAIEAMACGLPIITSNIHGIVDYSIDGITGYATTFDDLSGFANSILKLFEDEALRIEYGKHNLNSIVKYDVNNILLRLQEIYGRVMNDREHKNKHCNSGI
jgi:glycosyltransferase involved in cell wall biosynthesis